jgi:uncharacterized protein YecT (DUF1311 family)
MTTRALRTVAVAIVVVVALLAVLALQPERTAASTGSTTLPCSSAQLTTDYQIDQCLESKIHEATTLMGSLLRSESVYFRYASKSQDWRVALRTQSTFTSYAREECLAQVHPYRTGTIEPILYGECVLGFYDQRVDSLRQTITSFKQGGEARIAS